MNAHIESQAVAGSLNRLRTIPRQPRKPRKSRSKYAHVLDMTDEKEREVAGKLRYFELGGDYKCVQFHRSIGTDGQRILWAIVDTVPRWRDRGIRWSVHWWNIDTAYQGWHDRRTLDAAQRLLNSLTLH